MAKKNEIKKKEVTQGERFTAMVIKEFAGNVDKPQIAKAQRRLIQNYFIALDSVLKQAEIKRAMTTKKKGDPPITWQNVNMPKLAVDVVASARIGLDPTLNNHVSLIPYLNRDTKKYDIGFIEGYKGLEIKAVKYGLDVPDNIIIKIVHDNEEFIPIWRDMNNPKETYVFNPATNPFEESKIIGGFYYYEYKNNPEKNKLTVVTLKDIEKRKPEYASVEFWGGEKDEWVDKKRTGKKIKVEGWYEEMIYKTLYRMAYGKITIDSNKIDESYSRLKASELALTEHTLEQDIEKGANKENLDFDDAEVIQPEQLPENTEKTDNKEQPETDNKEVKTETKTEVTDKPLF